MSWILLACLILSLACDGSGCCMLAREVVAMLLHACKGVVATLLHACKGVVATLLHACNGSVC